MPQYEAPGPSPDDRRPRPALLRWTRTPTWIASCVARLFAAESIAYLRPREWDVQMVGKIRQVAYAVLTAALVGCSSTGTSPQSTTTLVTPAVTPGITPTLSVAATRASATAPATPGVFDASKPQGTGKPEGAGTPQGANKPQGAN